MVVVGVVVPKLLLIDSLMSLIRSWLRLLPVEPGSTAVEVGALAVLMKSAVWLRMESNFSLTPDNSSVVWFSSSFWLSRSTLTLRLKAHRPMTKMAAAVTNKDILARMFGSAGFFCAGFGGRRPGFLVFLVLTASMLMGKKFPDSLLGYRESMMADPGCFCSLCFGFEY